MQKPMTTEQKTLNAARQQRFRERQAAARAAELAQKGLPTAPAIPTMPSRARWNALIAQAAAALNACREEAQSYFDDRSEEWQESEKGEKIREQIEALENITEELGNVAF